jgi:hypothetical protein
VEHIRRLAHSICCAPGTKTLEHEDWEGLLKASLRFRFGHDDLAKLTAAEASKLILEYREIDRFLHDKPKRKRMKEIEESMAAKSRRDAIAGYCERHPDEELPPYEESPWAVGDN